METKEKTKKKNLIKPDITKLTGNFRFDISRCWISYTPGRDDDSNIPSQKGSFVDHIYNHHALWLKIISLLNRRVFNVVADQRVDKCIRKGYKYGKNKYGIEMKTNIYPNGFEMQFYQNVTKPENSNGGQYDFDKFARMPYLLKLSVKAEILAIEKLVKRFIKVEQCDPKENAVEFILNRFQTSSFTKNNIKSLDEMDSLMSDHDHSYNSQDKNKLKINNGDIKYFYDNKRLARGKAYHNINNMWWVILNDTTVTNISSNQLFDFVPGMPKRLELTTSQKAQKIHTALKTAEANQNYERCIVLRELLKAYKLYRIWSIKWGKWWGPDNGGYTSDINSAGVYTQQDIDKSPDYYNNLTNTEAKEV